MYKNWNFVTNVGYWRFVFFFSRSTGFFFLYDLYTTTLSLRVSRWSVDIYIKLKKSPAVGFLQRESVALLYITVIGIDFSLNYLLLLSRISEANPVRKITRNTPGYTIQSFENWQIYRSCSFSRPCLNNLKIEQFGTIIRKDGQFFAQLRVYLFVE